MDAIDAKSNSVKILNLSMPIRLTLMLFSIRGNAYEPSEVETPFQTPLSAVFDKSAAYDTQLALNVDALPLHEDARVEVHRHLGRADGGSGRRIRAVCGRPLRAPNEYM